MSMKPTVMLEIDKRLINGALAVVLRDIERLNETHGFFGKACIALVDAIVEINKAFESVIEFYERLEAMMESPDVGKGAYGPGLVDKRYTGD
jgi:hypothetical protein